jgi:hypothetical protein
MSHEELAEATGISAGTLRDWEEREAWCNSQEAIDKLAAALEFPAGFFVGSELETLEHWQVNFCHIEYDAVIICAGCGEPITGDELDDRHWGHAKDCPCYGLDEDGDEYEDAECTCGFLEYHAGCCPDCNEKEGEKGHSAIGVLTIPADAVALMTTLRPGQVYRRLMEAGTIAEIELLTFAYLNTPISDSPIYDPSRIIAYVSYWEGGHLTVCARDGNMVTLVADEPGPPPGEPDQALAIFRRHWTKRG